MRDKQQTTARLPTDVPVGLLLKGLKQYCKHIYQGHETKAEISTGVLTAPDLKLLIINGDWKQAVKKSLQKKRPAEGWPKPKETEK